MSNSENCPCYDNDQINYVQSVYIIGLIVWICMIFGLGIVPDDIVEIGIVAIPILVFVLAFYSIPEITDQIEGYMFKANLLTLGLLVAFPLITWAHSKSIEYKTLFITLATIAIIFSLFTLIDVWVSSLYLPVVKHIKSVLQTIAIILLVFGLYRFFIEKSREIGMDEEDEIHSES